MSKKTDPGPMVKHLQDYHRNLAYGTTTSSWGGARAAEERRIEQEKKRRAAQKPPASSSKTNDKKKTDTNKKVICTELVRQGLFDRADYLLGARYVEEHLTGRHVRGYHAWGLPVVRKMRRSPRATAFWRKLAQARADHIAFLYGDASRRNRLGAVLCAIGHPACYLIGGMVGEQDWRSIYHDERSTPIL
ncbi:hypothetical protein ADZ37_24460 [Pannonibacter phragmitetus]|uniref:hypothetical protein n=1 Tax=Pannonibacter phragmitetus TaxID=121719 RepID=UPI00067C468D|nr:hypothetical protein [Pannonibacter phragmitetus]KND16171.1 hypothetical protein ADZ37_24460 [Pannonibacter phragmitetus]